MDIYEIHSWTLTAMSRSPAASCWSVSKVSLEVCLDSPDHPGIAELVSRLLLLVPDNQRLPVESALQTELGREQVEGCHGKVADRNIGLRLLDAIFGR